MARVPARSAAVLVVLLGLPAVAFAQAAITGVVKDTSGAVLPGVTVEAASPVLIEKVRSVVSDDTGQYRIVNLLPGTYSVTFTLPGFSTVKRDGIELTGTFVATVNGDLKVGALEETITVTGETPVVDVQSAKVQQTVSKDIIAAIPSSRTASGIQSLIPGMSNNGDSGGISGGLAGSAGQIHGGSGQSSRTRNDGINQGWTGQSMGGGQLINVAGAQEVVISTSGGLGEADAGGVILDVIPRDGSNTFSGSFAANGASGAMQGSNYTQALKDQGLRAPSELMKVWDLNPMGGGRIIRDKLWFYLTYREVMSENTVPSMWFNKNAGNPNAWTVDFDLNRQAFVDTRDRNGIARITWQATPRNKINAHWSEQYNSSNDRGGGTATQTVEATNRTRYKPTHIQQLTWSSPVTSRLLVDAGMGTYDGRWSAIMRTDGTHNDKLIRVLEQGGQIPGLAFKFPVGYGTCPGRTITGCGFNHSRLGTKYFRAAVSYVTGAHNLKIGYQGGYNKPKHDLFNFGNIVEIRMNNGVINRLTQAANYPGGFHGRLKTIPADFFAQDQWTRGRLTLQGGVRFDNVFSSFPEERIGGPGYTLLPTEIVFPPSDEGGYKWHDVTPRVGVAYDLFGNGKTALKFNMGKYMEGFIGALHTAGQLSPLNRIPLVTQRSWADTNRDYVPQCDLMNPAKNGECGAMTDQNFGKEVFTTTYDSSFIHGWGTRPYNWSMGLSVQQELFPRVSMNVGYFRNSWGNSPVVDNEATSATDYTPFSIQAPLDPRLPDGGGQTISGLYNLVPAKVGQIDQHVQDASNFAETTENWQGMDVSVTARLRNGLTVQGGTSTGRRLVDSCAVRAVLPESPFSSTGSNDIPVFNDNAVTNPYCRVVEPYLTQVKGLAAYTIPRVDVQVSGTWASIPGSSQAANYVASNAVIAAGPQPLGRVLSGGAANVTVNLIAPSTVFGARRNTFDFRVAKIVRYRRTRAQIGIDIYNLTNTDVVTSYNQTFVPGGAWLTPSAIQPARYIKVSGQFDF